MPDVAGVLADLAAEQERLEDLLLALSPERWHSESGAPGWSVRDVVLHLAQTEEAVVASVRHGVGLPAVSGEMDQSMDAWVRREAGGPASALDRWRTARRDALRALQQADPETPVRWASIPLKPRTLATTRLAEHWAHGLDIAEPLGLPFADTSRLRHVAWLAHSSLPYAFTLAGLQPRSVFCDLVGPEGQVWQFGPPDSPSRITGDAGAFCRVGARRLTAERSGLYASDETALAALKALRNYGA